MDFKNFDIFVDGGKNNLNVVPILSGIFRGCTISYLQCNEHRNLFKVGGDPNNPVFSKNVNFSEIDRVLCKNYRRFRI